MSEVPEKYHKQTPNKNTKFQSTAHTSCNENGINVRKT